MSKTNRYFIEYISTIQYYLMKCNFSGGIKMIFNDVVQQFNARKKILIGLTLILNDLKNIYSSHNQWCDDTFSFICKGSIALSSSSATNGGQLLSNTNVHMSKLKQDLISIEFSDLKLILANLVNLDDESLTIKAFRN